MDKAKSDSFLTNVRSLLIPCATVFISSFCYFQTQGQTQDAENIKYYLQQIQSQKPGSP